MSNQFATTTYRWARRIAIAIVGGTVVAVGVVMIVAPGPAFLVIPAGLGILALEFAFARRWLEKIKTTSQSAMTYMKKKPLSESNPPRND